MPAISVVIPLYNKKDHVARAIDSVLTQGFRDYELIVVNDGSTDGGEAVVAAYKDPRIRLVQQSNGGESRARNAGVSNASNDYVAFLDADDAWDSNFLEIVNDLIERFPLAGAYATHIWGSFGDVARVASLYDPASPVDAWMIEDYFACLNSGYYPVTSSSVCVKRSILIELGGFNSSLAIGPDIDMWIRVFLHSGIALSNRYAATYYLDASNRSVQRADFSEKELQFFSLLRTQHLRSDVHFDSRSHLDQWTSRRIYEALIRLINCGGRVSALRALLLHWRHMRGHQCFHVAVRLIAPQFLKRLVRRNFGQNA